MAITGLEPRPIRRTGPVRIDYSVFDERGITFGHVEVEGCIAVSITDDDRVVTYDYETGNVLMAKGHERDRVARDAGEFLAKEPV